MSWEERAVVALGRGKFSAADKSLARSNSFCSLPSVPKRSRTLVKDFPLYHLDVALTRAVLDDDPKKFLRVFKKFIAREQELVAKLGVLL